MYSSMQALRPSHRKPTASLFSALVLRQRIVPAATCGMHDASVKCDNMQKV